MKEEKGLRIIIITHGDFGEKMLKAAEWILGAQEDVYTFSLQSKGFSSDVKEKIKKLLEKPTLILVDMIGGTPANLSLGFRMKNVQVVSGLSLPILLEVLANRKERATKVAPTRRGNLACPLDQLTRKAVKAGKKGVINLTQLLDTVCKK